MAPLLKLYTFRYRDPRTGKWTTARYRATAEEIRERYLEWELIGEPEIRGSVGPSFSSFAAQRLRARVVERREAPLAVQPHRQRPVGIDRTEAALLGIFLRRYVMYCARRGKFAAMGGAAALLREIAPLMT